MEVSTIIAISLVVLILGAVILISLWFGTVNLFTKHNDTVPTNIRLAFVGVAFCILAPPLTILSYMVFIV